ncbi:DNA translocase FtsK [Oscillibacter sp.]|uniref:FtsK/SpoIIIE family DNA translocase n=1 Tax=Oscillibacter sp. TaxID=1945593 RepID=UPI002898ED50|nr:DNA translocase FtsK [Oscillibacter sp.]
MASTTTKRSGAKKSSGGRKKPTQTDNRPIRREVGGTVCLLLALCAAVSYFGADAIFIDWFALLLKGLFGYGYWLCAPALVLAGLILLIHHGRPVTLRTICALLLPLLFGSLAHMILLRDGYELVKGILKLLWSSGGALKSGGAVSGLLAVGAVSAFSKVASIMIFAVCFLVVLMGALRITPKSLMEKRRSRPRYEPEPEPAPRPAPAIPAVPSEGPGERSGARRSIDIPLDGEQRPAPEKKPGLIHGFFRQKSDQQLTPDQLLTDETAKAAKPHAQPVQVPAPLPAVIPEPIAVPEPAAAPAVAAVFSPAPAPIAPPTPAPATEKPGSAAKEVAAATAEVTAQIEDALSSGEGAYQFPPITLLDENRGGDFTEAGAELRNNARRLGETLKSFGVEATPGEVVHGPTVTRYEFVLDQGVKLSKITNLADDIALALGASGVRIAPIPDKISVVGIEVPNRHVSSVLIRDVVESGTFVNHKSAVAFSVGKDIGGHCIVGDIARLPHVLIAGTTGSGKSVCTNSLIVSLMYKSSPDEVRFIMVDPKMVELAPYNGIPHLLIPVVTDPKKAAGALQWAVYEMMKRYKLFSENNVKDLKGYNTLARTSEELTALPSVVVVIDELADLMLVAAKEVEESICRVAQMGRAAGMHLVIATQRPSADVITGIMKANIPSRIAFAVASALESRIILDTQGAEKLVGRGDMLYAPLGSGKPTRVQGCFISPEEIERVVEFAKESGEAHYSDEVMRKIEENVQEKEKTTGSKGASAAADAEDEGDELLPAAVDVVLETGQASVSMLQRRLKLGYSRAARLVDQMEQRGIVGPFEGSKPRQLLISRQTWQEQQMGGAALPPSDEPPFDDGPEEED